MIFFFVRRISFVHQPLKIINGLPTNSTPFYLKLVFYEIFERIETSQLHQLFVLIKHKNYYSYIVNEKKLVNYECLGSIDLANLAIKS